jgi:hypothetical protein
VRNLKDAIDGLGAALATGASVETLREHAEGDLPVPGGQGKPVSGPRRVLRRR